MATHPESLTLINNEVYASLGERWYSATDDPIALLRAESRLRNPWLERELRASFGARPSKVLDVGCGGGFLSNYLAARGHEVTGLDASADALRIAAEHDSSGRARYRRGDALALPFPDASFDAVCVMDFLEHVDNPGRVVAEAARVLVPGGKLFFHTFNRNRLAWLIIIKGVEWFVRNTPPQLHVLRLFIKPAELSAICQQHGLSAPELRGVRPCLSWAFLRMLLTGRVPDDFAFTFTRSTGLGYSGVTQKFPARSLPHE